MSLFALLREKLDKEQQVCAIAHKKNGPFQGKHTMRVATRSHLP